MCKYAREQGWYYDYIWFESVYRYWSSTRCEEEARKYKKRSRTSKRTAMVGIMYL